MCTQWKKSHTIQLTLRIAKHTPANSLIIINAGKPTAMSLRAIAVLLTSSIEKEPRK